LAAWKTIGSGSTLGVAYDVMVRTGAVTGTESRSQTEVSGSISGGQGTIKSETTTAQDIFLTDEDGVEFAAGLHNFRVRCKEGQDLCLLSVETKKRGLIFHAINLSTR